MYKIGLIGAGKMGMSIINGIIDSKLFSRDEIIISANSDNTKIKLENEGFNTIQNNKYVYENSNCVILAIKPQNFNKVLEELKDVKKEENIVISVAAGIKVCYIKNYLNGDIIRVMPNTPAVIKYGTTAIATDNVSDKSLDLAKKIFESVGSTSFIKEDEMDKIIPLNGSMPAFVFYFMKSFIEAGVNQGLDYNLCKELVLNTFLGSAKLALKSDKSIEQLLIDVCSPGGTTIEGIKALDEGCVDKDIEKCFIDCMNRSIELGKK